MSVSIAQLITDNISSEMSKALLYCHDQVRLGVPRLAVWYS